MKSEKNKITKQIGISLAIIGILFLAIVTLNLSKNEEIIIFCFMYGFMVFMVFNLFKISKARSTSGDSFFPASGSDRTDRIGRHFHLGFCLLERTDCDPSAGYRLGYGDSVRPLHRAASEM